MTQITFSDLYQYILTCERSDFGYHYPFGQNSNTYFHVYNGKVQMNLCMNDMPVAVFLFRPEEDTVRLCSVSESGVADYDSEHYVIPLSTPISGADVKTGWPSKFGARGGAVKEVLRDALSPWLVQREKDKLTEQEKMQKEQAIVYAKLARINTLSGTLNHINATYPRYTGTIIMVNKETEDEIYMICNEILDIIKNLEDHDYANALTTFERADVVKTVSIVKSGAEENLKEVEKAKKFLENYLAD